MSTKNAKQSTLLIDPQAKCCKELAHRDDPTSLMFAVVRDGQGRVIGRHRVPKIAWESAFSTLARRRLLEKGST